MTDTPNTSRPSEAIQRWHLWIEFSGPRNEPEIVGAPNDDGDYVLHSDHLAALARAREEARREALEEAARVLQDISDPDLHPSVTYRIAQRWSKIIRALIHTTPQGETKEQQP